MYSGPVVQMLSVHQIQLSKETNVSGFFKRLTFQQLRITPTAAVVDNGLSEL